MAEEMDISVSFQLELPGGDTAVTAPRQAELYDEEHRQPGHKNDRCVAITGITDAGGNPLPWVDQYVTKVIIYSDSPSSLALGNSGEVGLTSEEKAPWTKPKRVMVADPLGAFTVEGLRKAGLI